MELTHYGHAALHVEINERSFLVDPGGFSSGFNEIRSLDAILITHQHWDHFDQKAVQMMLRMHPEAHLYVDTETNAAIDVEIDSARVHTVGPGDSLRIGQTEIQVVGGLHARIHRDIPLVVNVGYFFSDVRLLHPGDAFFVPNREVKTLALPMSGPWQSLEDAVEYLREVKPIRAFPVHEALLSRPEIYYDYLERLKPEGTQITILDPGQVTNFPDG